MVVGEKGSGWELRLLVASLIPLALQRRYGCRVAVNDWVCVPGLALDECHWCAIYRLLNIPWVAGRRGALSLPTSVRVERDAFPL